MPNRRDYFESFADEWDKMFTAGDLEILEFLINSIGVPVGSYVADLGCGTGILFDLLRRHVGDTGLVVGVDFSSRMLLRARQNFPFDNIVVVESNVEQLPFKTEVFDRAISFASFAHFEHQDHVVDEASRILKTGGTFHIIHLFSSKELEKHHQMAGGPVANDHLPNRQRMQEIFEKGRFGEIKITDHPGLYVATGIKG